MSVNKIEKDYNKKAEEYERLVGGRTVIEDQDEYEKLVKIRSELEQIRLELEEDRKELMREAQKVSRESENLGNCRRMPLGVVKSVEIYW